MYADKDSRGLVSVLEMDRPDWTALQDAARMAVGVWRIQLREFDGVRPSPEVDTDIIQRIMFLKERIASCVNFVNQVDTVDGKRPERPFNPFEI